MTYSVEETLRIQTLKLNQQLNKLLEQNTQILELEAERDTLKQQNAELAAQVSLLIYAINKNCFGKCYEPDGSIGIDGYPWAFEVLSKIETPAQCLLEAKADAGRAGFIAGYRSFSLLDMKHGIDLKADEYANKIRGGE